MVSLMKPNLYRHDSYGNQYPGQATPPTGSYPNQPGMYQQQVTFPFLLDRVLSGVIECHHLVLHLFL